MRHLFKVDSLDQQGDKNTDISFDNGRLTNKSMLDVDRTNIVHSNLIKNVTRRDVWEVGLIVEVEVWLSHDDNTVHPRVIE